MKIDFTGLYNILVQNINWMAQFIVDFFLYIPRQIYAWLMQSLGYAVNSVPDPCCFGTFVDDYHALTGLAGGSLGSAGGIDLASGIAYVVGWLQIPFGIRICMCALVARFVLRRIPGVG